MKRYLNLFLCVGIFSAAVALCAGGIPPTNHQTGEAASEQSHHNSPSIEPLPAVLDPAQFTENHAAYVAYTLASRIPQTLYQVPCYCGCDKNHGHESLLDCFTGTHGTHCRICQNEAIFCFLQQKKRKSPAAVREALAQGKITNFDLEKYTRRFYSQLRKQEK